MIKTQIKAIPFIRNFWAWATVKFTILFCHFSNSLLMFVHPKKNTDSSSTGEGGGGGGGGGEGGKGDLGRPSPHLQTDSKTFVSQTVHFSLRAGNTL